MAEAIRAYAHADISIPKGWNSENTIVEVRFVVKRIDTGRRLPADRIESEVDEVIEEDED